MRVFLVLFFLNFNFVLTAQDDPNIVLMDTEDTWRKEAFTFPKPFAPEVDFEGVADCFGPMHLLGRLILTSD